MDNAKKKAQEVETMISRLESPELREVAREIFTRLDAVETTANAAQHSAHQAIANSTVRNGVRLT